MRLAAAILLAAATFAVAPAADADGTPTCVGQGEFNHVDDVVSPGNPKTLAWVQNQFSDQQLSSVSKYSGGVLVAKKFPSCAWTPKDVLVPVHSSPQEPYWVTDICLAAHTNDWSC